jgi:hypothetical protein
MRALKILLAINAVFFLVRGLINVVQPTAFYLESDAPGYAMDAVRVLGITYLVLGLIQLGTWWVADRRAVGIVAFASLLFALGVAVQVATQGSASTDGFHQADVFGPLTLNNAAMNVLWAVLYAGLLLRESRMAMPRVDTTGLGTGAQEKAAAR